MGEKVVSLFQAKKWSVPMEMALKTATLYLAMFLRVRAYIARAL